jgi:hypothetical protein
MTRLVESFDRNMAAGGNESSALEPVSLDI